MRIGLQGHQPFMAAVKAMHDTLKALREGTAPKDLSGVPGGDFMATLTREDEYAAWTKEFLGG